MPDVFTPGTVAGRPWRADEVDPEVERAYVDRYYGGDWATYREHRAGDAEDRMRSAACVGPWREVD